MVALRATHRVMLSGGMLAYSQTHVKKFYGPRFNSLASLSFSTAGQFPSRLSPLFAACCSPSQLSFVSTRQNLEWAGNNCISKRKSIHTVCGKLSKDDRVVVEKYESRLEQCQKHTSKVTKSRLCFDDNIMGIDLKLKNGNMSPGSLNHDLLEFKKKFPDEVLLCRVGEFYEAVGFDAIMLLEYAGLNPMGGLKGQGVPKAGCPRNNLTQTLADLNEAGLSVCVVEEAVGNGGGKGKKKRFVSGHSRPGSPYLFGLAKSGVEIDSFPPEALPVVGLGRDSRGYTVVQVYEMMMTYAVEEGLTEEAAVAKLRTSGAHLRFVHQHHSLRDSKDDLSRWSRSGAGGQLWAEVDGRDHEWYGGDMVNGLLQKVRLQFDVQPHEQFTKMKVPTEPRPRPIYMSTATQIGIERSAGVPSLLKFLLPHRTHGLCYAYLKALLLKPPPIHVAVGIQECCQMMGTMICPLPSFPLVQDFKLSQLVRAKEMNAVELRRVKRLAGAFMDMGGGEEGGVKRAIRERVLAATALRTGLGMEEDGLVEEASKIYSKISDVVADESEYDPVSASEFPAVDQFFQDSEEGWRDRIKRCHVDKEYEEVERAGWNLNSKISLHFSPVVTHCQMSLQSGGSAASKAEISYSKDRGAVWIKGKNIVTKSKILPLDKTKSGIAACLAMVPAADLNDRGGKKGKVGVGREWFTHPQVDQAIIEYSDACARAEEAVISHLVQLAERLQQHQLAIINLATFSVIAHTLYMHTREAHDRRWCHPTLLDERGHVAVSPSSATHQHPLPRTLSLTALFPYWLQIGVDEGVVSNDVSVGGMVVLTGPNGGGKSSLLRGMCTAALLATCGLLVPAQRAVVPCYDSIVLRMMGADSPCENRSSFQMEMRELGRILGETRSSSFLLVDELCRGTEVGKGTAIVGAALERWRGVGCSGILSTHLHGLGDMWGELGVEGVGRMKMGVEVDGRGQLRPTWRVEEGVCCQSLAFEMAEREGVDTQLLQRANQLYHMFKHTTRGGGKGIGEGEESTRGGEGEAEVGVGMGEVGERDVESWNRSEQAVASGLGEAELVEGVVGREKGEEGGWRGGGEDSLNLVHLLEEILGGESREFLPEGMELRVLELPPHTMPSISTSRRSCVYVAKTMNGLYVGQSDDIRQRVQYHRHKLRSTLLSLFYFTVSDKSCARMVETKLILALRARGHVCVNKGDETHKRFGSKG